MSELLDDLRKVLVGVLEDFTFTFTDVVQPNELPVPGKTCFLGSISVEAPRKVYIEAAAPIELCSLFAANILGTEPDEDQPRAIVEDALREILNVTCGELVEQLDSEAVPKLSIPAVKEIDRGAWLAMVQAGDVRHLLVDELPMLIRISES